MLSIPIHVCFWNDLLTEFAFDVTIKFDIESAYESKRKVGPDSILCHLFALTAKLKVVAHRLPRLSFRSCHRRYCSVSKSAHTKHSSMPLRWQVWRCVRSAPVVFIIAPISHHWYGIIFDSPFGAHPVSGLPGWLCIQDTLRTPTLRLRSAGSCARDGAPGLRDHAPVLAVSQRYLRFHRLRVHLEVEVMKAAK
jgi:hypothetical protein